MSTDPPPTILVADDDPEILAMLVTHLRRAGARVVEAANGDQALERTRSERPDLLILDVMMPGLSGWEVCRALREDPLFSGIRVLMLTGIGERLNELTSPLYGADDFLDKPFDFGTLDSRIEKLIGRPLLKPPGRAKP